MSRCVGGVMCGVRCVRSGSCAPSAADTLAWGGIASWSVPVSQSFNYEVVTAPNSVVIQPLDVRSSTMRARKGREWLGASGSQGGTPCAVHQWTLELLCLDRRYVLVLVMSCLPRSFVNIGGRYGVELGGSISTRVARVEAAAEVSPRVLVEAAVEVTSTFRSPARTNVHSPHQTHRSHQLAASSYGRPALPHAIRVGPI